MRHSQLRAFHFVALHGGFSRAALAMSLTQPAVSDQVRKLEREYDVLLFTREKKQVTLTKQGHALLEITHALFEVETRALDFLTEARTLTTGTLRIIADSAHHITNTLSQFRVRYPNIIINMRTGNSQDVLDELHAYHADIGVLGNMPQHNDFEQIHLGSSPIVAFAAKGIAPSLRPEASFETLAEHKLVLREKGSKTRQKLEEAAAKQGIELIPAIEAEGREAVREIVASGAGIGFVSDAEYGQDERLHKFRIKGPPIPMEESVICLRHRKDVRLISAFMELAKKTKPHISRA